MTILDLADSCRPRLSHSEAKRIAFHELRKLRSLDWRIYQLEPCEVGLLRPMFAEATKGPVLPGILPEPAPQVFLFDKWRVRVAIKDGTPWFVARDVTEALGYVRFDSNLLGHIREEWKGTSRVRTPGGEQNLLILSLPGLFFFLNRSDKPAALPFQEWVNGEVLVAIHKTGAYAVPGVWIKPPKAKPASTFSKPSAALVRECRLAVKDNALSRDDIRRLLGLDAPIIQPEEPKASPELGERKFAEIRERLGAGGQA